MENSSHNAPRVDIPHIAFGMVSIVLGTIGLLLFFLPILGIPLGACGLLFGIVGVLSTGLGSRSKLRWSVAGIVVSVVTLGIGFAIAFAPLGYEPRHAVPRLWQTPPDRPRVPPPARSVGV